MRLAVRLVAAVLVLTGGALAAGPTVAGASATIGDSGWWWRAQASSTVTVPSPPLVPEGGVMVQGAPDGAAALAAMKFTLGEGEANPVLTLTLAPAGSEGADTAVVLACQAGSGWTGGGAQPWEGKPSPACEAGSAPGELAEDGKSMSFDLSAVQFGTEVNIILVPGVSPTLPPPANNSVFTLVFEKPEDGSLATEEGFAPLPAPPPPSGSFSSGSFSPGSSAASSSGSGSYSPAPPAASSIAPPPPAAALPAAEQGMTATAPATQALTNPVPAVAESVRSSRYRAVGILVLLLGLAAGVYSWRQPVPALRGLGRFAAPEPAAAAGAPAVPAGGGLGRFARPRSGQPPRLT